MAKRLTIATAALLAASLSSGPSAREVTPEPGKVKPYWEPTFYPRKSKKRRRPRPR
jgi:hypothetical protein